ncbi:hypothetical protein JXA05_02340 [Candidatus Peregrinibacteria bacterium]|nr:hypothetical protein [Candidatus Peregrinibacteria bacterium]
MPKKPYDGMDYSRDSVEGYGIDDTGNQKPEIGYGDLETDLQRVEDEPNSIKNIQKRKERQPPPPPFVYTPPDSPVPESKETDEEQESWEIINGVRVRLPKAGHA